MQWGTSALGEPASGIFSVALNLYVKTFRASRHQGALILTRRPDLVHLSVQSKDPNRGFI